MALRSHLLRTLDDKKEPLPKRLKIADNAFKSMELPLQQREMFLLKWLSDQSQHDSKETWIQFYNWISSEQMKELTRNDVNEEDIFFLSEFISNRLNDSDDVEIKRILVKIYFVLLENVLFRQYYKFNYKKYCEFILCIISNIDEVDLLLELIKNENIFNKTYLVEEKFQKYFIELIVGLFGNFYEHTNKNLFQEISDLIRKCIFQRNVNNFVAYYKIFFEEEEGEVPQIPKVFFKKLKLYNELDVKKSQFVLKLLVDAYYEAFSKDFLMVYKFFIILIESFGFNVSASFKMNNLHLKLLNSQTEWGNSLAKLVIVLEVLSEKKCTLDMKVNNVVFSEFLLNLVKTIIGCAGGCSILDVYRVLNCVIAINPLLIESLIDDLLTYIMFSDNQNSKTEYEQLLESIFEVYSKLHRIQKLVFKLVQVVQLKVKSEYKKSDCIYEFVGTAIKEEATCTQYNVEEILPQRVLVYFSQCVSSLASWQVMNLFKTLMFHLNAFVEEDLKTVANDKLLYIEIITILICQLLSSVRMAENSVPSIVVTKFVNGMQQLQNILGKFGSFLVTMEHNHVLMAAFLNISYCWAELYITLAYYSINNGVEIQKTVNTDFSACNLIYLHSYLTTEQWCLISQRISNFGEKPCIFLMNKLFIQKIKAMLLFEKTLNKDDFNSVLNEMSLNLHENYELLISEPFGIYEMLPKLSEDHATTVAEVLLQNITKTNNLCALNCIVDNKILVQALLHLCLTKIDKYLKQKKKNEEIDDGILVSTKIVSCVNRNHCKNELKHMLSIFNEEFTKQSSFKCIKYKEEKLMIYLDVIKKLPVPCMPDITKTVLFVYLASVLFDLNMHNSTTEKLQENIESILIGIVQHGSLYFDTEIKANILTYFTINHTIRYQELFQNIVENVLLKNENTLTYLKPVISCLNKNITQEKYLQCAIIVLHSINKFKKKYSSESKTALNQYKEKICCGIIKLITQCDEEHKSNFIEAYALALKYSLTLKVEENLSKLTPLLDSFIDSSFEALNAGYVDGSILLFSTILNYKTKLGDKEDDFIMKVWNSCKIVEIPEKQTENYSKLIVLIFEHISAALFNDVTSELLKLTIDSVEERDYVVFAKQMKSWNFILQCSFNPTKSKVWQNIVQEFLRRIVLTSFFTEDVHAEVFRFECNLVHTLHFTLSSSTIDICFITIMTVIKQNKYFINTYRSCIMILESLLKYRKAFITDRLPSYLQQYRNLLLVLCKNSDSELKLNLVEIQEVSDCAHQFEKLTNNLTTYGKHVMRISPYLISDILQQYETVALYSNVKLHLNNCLYSLISLCDQHAVSYLLRTLSTASTEIFKVTYENYKKYYRFTGKV